MIDSINCFHWYLWKIQFSRTMLQRYKRRPLAAQKVWSLPIQQQNFIPNR